MGRETADDHMTSLVRLIRLFRRGTAYQRLQAGLGILLVFAALVWLILNLWIVLLLFAGFLLGIFLIARSLRGSPPSS